MSIKDFWSGVSLDGLMDKWLALKPAARIGITAVAVFLLLTCVVHIANAQSAVTVSLSAEPAEGVETVTPTLIWGSTGAVSCVASGGWSGAKAPSGVETLPPIDRTTSYGLSCSAADGSATLTWTAPTEYTNGDPLPLSDLGGFKIYYGEGASRPGTVTDVPNEAATTYRIDGLTAAEWGFAMSAYTDGGVESELTPDVFKVVQVAASSAETSVSVLLKPNPPTLVTVESVVYELKLNPATQVASLGRRVGAIAYGVPCQGDALVTTRRGEFYEVPNDSVLLTKAPKSSAVVARCDLI